VFKSISLQMVARDTATCRARMLVAACQFITWTFTTLQLRNNVLDDRVRMATEFCWPSAKDDLLRSNRRLCAVAAAAWA
jgi:hypothetical protein